MNRGCLRQDGENGKRGGMAAGLVRPRASRLERAVSARLAERRAGPLTLIEHLYQCSQKPKVDYVAAVSPLWLWL